MFKENENFATIAISSTPGIETPPISRRTLPALPRCSQHTAWAVTVTAMSKSDGAVGAYMTHNWSALVLNSDVTPSKPINLSS